MYTLLQRIHDRGRLPRRPPPSADVLQSFTVSDEGKTMSAQAFIDAETSRLTPVAKPQPSREENIEATAEGVQRTKPTLKPIDQRPRQQTGLEQFMSAIPTPVKQQPPTPIEPTMSQHSLPILDGKAHREREQLASAAASATVSSLSLIHI